MKSFFSSIIALTEQPRFTAIWMNQNGRRQEVARHANIVAAHGSRVQPKEMING
jgi:hypothetical protein